MTLACFRFLGRASVSASWLESRSGRVSVSGLERILLVYLEDVDVDFDSGSVVVLDMDVDVGPVIGAGLNVLDLS